MNWILNKLQIPWMWQPGLTLKILSWQKEPQFTIRSEFNSISPDFLEGNPEWMRMHQQFTTDELKKKSMIKFLVGHRIKFQSNCQIVSKKREKVCKWMLVGNSIFFARIGKAEVLSLPKSNYCWSHIITDFDIRITCKTYLEIILKQSN